MTDKNVEAVCEEHRKRAAHGLTKYGVSTERTDFSPREWLQNLQEELMDATVYAERLKQELEPNPALVLEINGALAYVEEARSHVHHTNQRSLVALREANKALYAALKLAGG